MHFNKQLEPFADYLDLSSSDQVALYTDALAETNIQIKFEKFIELSLKIIKKDTNEKLKKTIEQNNRLTANLEHVIGFIHSLGCDETIFKEFQSTSNLNSVVQTIPSSYFIEKSQQLKELFELPEENSKFALNSVPIGFNELVRIRKTVQKSMNIDQIKKHFEEIANYYELQCRFLLLIGESNPNKKLKIPTSSTFEKKWPATGYTTPRERRRSKTADKGEHRQRKLVDDIPIKNDDVPETKDRQKDKLSRKVLKDQENVDSENVGNDFANFFKKTNPKRKNKFF